MLSPFALISSFPRAADGKQPVILRFQIREAHNLSCYCICKVFRLRFHFEALAHHQVFVQRRVEQLIVGQSSDYILSDQQIPPLWLYQKIYKLHIM